MSGTMPSTSPPREAGRGFIVARSPLDAAVGHACGTTAMTTLRVEASGLDVAAHTRCAAARDIA